MIRFLYLTILIVSSLFLTSGLDARSSIQFERDIRPIFAEKCTLCHGPDEAKGGLRLTGIDAATAILESGKRAILPGQVNESVILDRIHASDPDEMMPPPGKAEPLTADEKRLLEQWIAEGANWPQHWAYTPLQQPEAPAIGQTEWIKSSIDRFVLAKLEREKIVPSHEANSITLIRRLYYDLLGMVPTIEKVDHYQALLERDRETGLEQLVDDLLSSQHFGERWGRHWLDKARYADSDGYEKDNGRPDAWKFRDWVIRAINADMPLDQFTIEQFAGDLLEDPSPDQLVATAFNRQTLTNTEGGTDREQWRVAAVMDRVETLGSVWMGLTLTCARCHTHKYDEITQNEYYQLFAYFNNGDETTTKVPTSAAEMNRYEEALAAHHASLAARRDALATMRESLRTAFQAWESEARRLLAEAADHPTYAPITINDTQTSGSVKLGVRDDGALFAEGAPPDKVTYTISGRLPAGQISALRLEVLPHENLPARGPGRADNGNFVLTDLLFEIEGEKQIFAASEASHSQKDWHVSEAIDDDADSGWAVSPKMGVAHEAIFALSSPISFEGAVPFTVTLAQNHGKKHTLGHFRLSLLTSPTQIVVPKPLRAILTKEVPARTTEESDRLWRHFARNHPETRELIVLIEKAESEAPKKPEMTVRVLSEREKERRATHVFRRGEFKQPQNEVDADTLATLPPVRHRDGSTGDRLDLARWLVNGENPLPPRVLVNHIWSHLFGHGLVTTLNDFGVRGERPSHPRLLDWLAAELIKQGWSRKQLIKTIVLSSTYRQRSHHRPELIDRDPKNRLLARQNRFRVEAEIVRDLSLSAAGLLSPKIGGPSVFPLMPAGVSDVNYNSAFKWKVSEGEDRYRRGLYTYFKRTAPHPNLMTFDCPDSNVTCVQRTRSNTPLAALITLNNDTFTEAARALALRVLDHAEVKSDAERLRLAFRLCLSRHPEEAELTRLMTLLEESTAWYEDHPDEAIAFAGEAHPVERREKIASFTATVRVLLNLDEFLTRG